MKRIYNIISEITIWRGTDYTIDGETQSIDPPFVMLTEITLPDPVFDPMVETLTRKNRVDIQNKLWIEEATVRPLTAEELAAAARKVWPTSADYLIEFTFQEIAEISLSTDPTIAALRLLLASWNGEVWSDDPRVINGLNILESLNIITSERKLQILSK